MQGATAANQDERTENAHHAFPHSKSASEALSRRPAMAVGPDEDSKNLGRQGDVLQID